MIPLKTYQQRSSFFFSISKPNPVFHTSSLQHKFLSLQFPSTSPPPKFPLTLKPTFPLLSSSFPIQRVSKIGVQICCNKREEDKLELHDLSPNGPVYQKTLQLVECSMFAALTGLVYFLSNSLAIEDYFGYFFPLPIVISSMRWGIDAGRKTLVATTILLFVLSAPVKALTYLLKYGIVGYTMGTLWRLKTSWSLSIFLCAIVQSVAIVGFALISSFLIRENIIALSAMNIHATLTFVLTSAGVNSIPSMNLIYTLFGISVLIHSGMFMFLLHLMYSDFLPQMGMKSLLTLPRWLERTI